MRTILLVEDSITDAFVINNMLSDLYRIIHIHHANQILEEVKMHRPDLIIMDVVMPGRNGFEATRMLKSDDESRSIPIIICTSKSMATDHVWALRSGADNYLTKPLANGGLLSMARLLLNRENEVARTNKVGLDNS